jgi:hypothetical protein
MYRDALRRKVIPQREAPVEGATNATFSAADDEGAKEDAEEVLVSQGK